MERDFCEKSEWYDKNAQPERVAVPNFLWVATGNSQSGKISDIKRYLLDKFKIGWIDIEVQGEIPDDWDIADHYLSRRAGEGEVAADYSEDYGTIRVGRRLYEYRIINDAGIQEGSRRSAHHIIKQLIPEMKNSVAGVTADKANIVTPFKLTVQRTVEVMEDGKWYTGKELLEELRNAGHDHHYSKDSTYKSSIGGWLVKFGHAEANNDWHKKYRKN
jgi:hypothetical protein